MISSIKGHNIVTRCINRHSVVLDLGANKGEFARKLFDKTGAKILSVEPFVDNFNRILALDGGKKFNVAVSDVSRNYYLVLNDNSESNYLTDIEPVGRQYSVVEGVTFASIIEQNNIDRLSLLKMDIEGTEIRVLRTISRSFLQKINQITIEFHDFLGDGSVSKEDVKQTCSYLRQNGFSVIKFSPRSFKDVLFLNKMDFKKSDILKIRIFYRAKYLIALVFSKLFNGDL